PAPPMPARSVSPPAQGATRRAQLAAACARRLWPATAALLRCRPDRAQLESGPPVVNPLCGLGLPTHHGSVVAPAPMTRAVGVLPSGRFSGPRSSFAPPDFWTRHSLGPVRHSLGPVRHSLGPVRHSLGPVRHSLGPVRR